MFHPASLRSDPLAGILGTGGRFPSEQTAGFSGIGNLGLGTCWIGGFDPLKAKEILTLDDNLHVVALLPIGYPKRIPAQRPRFPLERFIVKTV
jgi:hypothetical protein